MLEDLAGVAAQPDAPALHHDAVRRRAEADADVLLDEQHRLSRLVHHLHVVVDGTEDFRIEPERGLVEQDQLGIHHQGARELDLSALPAGEIPRAVGGTLPNELEHLLDLRVAAAQKRAVAADRVAAEQHVLADRHLRKDPVRLRHLDDAVLEHVLALGASDVVALELDLSEPRTQEARQRAEDSRLPRAVRTDDARDRATLDVEIDALEDVAPAVAADDAAHAQERRHACTSGTASSTTQPSPR